MDCPDGHNFCFHDIRKEEKFRYLVVQSSRMIENSCRTFDRPIHLTLTLKRTLGVDYRASFMREKQYEIKDVLIEGVKAAPI